MLITGQQRSGKSFITNLISTLKGPLNIKINFFLDNLIELRKNKFLTKDQFKDIFLIFLDIYFIDSVHGRNLNFKKDEETSIWNNSSKFYLNRIKTKISKSKLKKILKKENEIFFVVHNFIEFKSLFEGEKLDIKIIYLEQDPIDHIFSLYNSNINKKINDIDRSLLFSYGKVKFLNNIYNYEKKIFKLSKMGKVLLLKYLSDQKDKKELKIKNRNINVLKINYKQVFKNQYQNIDKLTKFIKKVKTKKTIDFFRKAEQIKRIDFLSEAERAKRKKFILSKIKEEFEIKLFKKILRNNK